MGYPLSACLQLRAGIARALNMPFQSLFSSGQSVITAGVNTYTDNNLTQENNFWKYQWLFIPELNHVTKISGNTGGVLQVEKFVAFTGGKNYEIYQIFTPIDILWSINQAITSSYPYYYDKHSFVNFAFGVSKYPLDILTPTPAGVRFFNLEIPKQPYWVKADTIVYSAGVVTITGNFSEPPKVGWIITVTPNAFAGLPFSGTVTSADTTQISFNIPTSLHPKLLLTTDSRVLYYNPAYVTVLPYSFVKTNREEFPDEILVDVNQNYIGTRILITYTSIPQEIDFGGSTIVPSGYIIPKAVSLLASSKMMDTRIDTRRWQSLIEIYSNQAEQFKMRYPFKEGFGDLWTVPSYPIDVDYFNSTNPLGW